jgi:hypothetical protein
MLIPPDAEPLIPADLLTATDNDISGFEGAMPETYVPDKFKCRQ